MRIWIEKESVVPSLTEDGDLVINAEDFYFFKRNEIANEDGYHLEFASTSGASFEMYLTYQEYNRFIKQMLNSILEYGQITDYNA